MALNSQGIAQALHGFPSTEARALQSLFELTDGAAAQSAAEDAKEAAEALAVSATTSTKGVVKQAENQADSTATDATGIVSDFNDLLAKLKTAGLMAADS